MHALFAVARWLRALSVSVFLPQEKMTTRFSELRRAFRTLDEDASGNLSHDEFKQVMAMFNLVTRAPAHAAAAALTLALCSARYAVPDASADTRVCCACAAPVRARARMCVRVCGRLRVDAYVWTRTCFRASLTR